MAQASYTIPDSNGITFLSNLNAFAQAVQSTNAGPAPPADTAPGMLWLDTGADPPVLRLRNPADDGWERVIGLPEPAANGIAVRTGAGLAVARTLQPGTGIAIGNANGVSGNPAIAVAPEGIGTAELATGAVTLPKLAGGMRMTTANVLGAMAGAEFGAVGTLAFLQTVSTTGLVEGASYAGSALRPGGLYSNSSLNTTDSAVGVDLTGSVAGLAGTWRAMGRSNNNTGSNRTRATLFLRIV